MIRWQASIGLLIGVFFVGCGGQPATYPVHGKLKFEDGTHPMFGDVEFFHPERRINARGKVERDGTFTLTTYEEGDGAVLGTHQVIVQQHTNTYYTSKLDRVLQHDHGEMIDLKHFDYRTSGLECEVTRGENHLELIVLKRDEQKSQGK